MAATDDRLERITNLVLVLLNTTRPLSLREIGTMVAGYPAQEKAIRQAFERDKRTLRDCGIPIAVERLGGESQVGYLIHPEDYYLPDLGLSDSERAALVLALVAVRLDGSFGNDVLHKLGEGAADVAPVAVLPVLSPLAPLEEAIRHRQVVRLDFRGRARLVEGYGLVFRNGAWYFVGRDTGAPSGHDVRTFRVDRIAAVAADGRPGAYEVPPDVDLAAETHFVPFVLGDDESDEADLRVDVREVDGLLSILGKDAVVGREEDGSATLRFPVGDDDVFVRWVVGLGDSAEVIGPLRLRRAVVEALEEAASR